MDVRVVKVGALEASRSSGDGTAEQTSEAAAGFVNNIRSAGPYLHMHAGQTMVRKIAILRMTSLLRGHTFILGHFTRC